MDEKKFKKVLIFMPFIGIGGVEKNLFIISNFLSKKVEQTLSSKLNLKCKTVADAVDAFFVAEGREHLQKYHASYKSSS